MKNNYDRNKRDEDPKKGKKGYRGKGGHGNRKPKADPKGETKDGLLDATDRDNDPNWYFTDAKLAEQVSQMSFQQLAGYPFSYGGIDINVPNIVQVNLNPCPGVQLSSRYASGLNQVSPINLAGFKLFQQNAAYTGRQAIYSPTDMSTMLLQMGELISQVEWIRRAFGVAFTTSVRNRSYPRQVLQFGMYIDADDFFTNFSDYRTKFNALITLTRQIPIPKGITYFEKCAALYEKIYLDAPSTMAQTIVFNPSTTWLMDETSYSGGTILSTTSWINQVSGGNVGVQTMAYWLNKLETTIATLMNSSTLNVVYTDMLNLSQKIGLDFWLFDYLSEGYQVVPEYSQNALLQWHNATIAGLPNHETQLVTGTDNVTPYNDVYPNPNTNTLFYNPAFGTVGNIANGIPRTGAEAVIDMLNDAPSLVDRVEVTRYVAISGQKPYKATGRSVQDAYIDAALPDHYATSVYWIDVLTGIAKGATFSTVVQSTTTWDSLTSACSCVDWMPRFFKSNAGATALDGNTIGDLNFYTLVDIDYVRKLHDFMGIGLYELRKGKS